MALARKRHNNLPSSAGHRTWRDPGGTVNVTCRPSDEATLMHLANTADRIVLRQPPGRQADARTLAQIVDALGAVKTLNGRGMQHPEAILRRLRLLLGDRLARLRIVGGFHFLAGTFKHATVTGAETVLVLSPASRRVGSCDWELAL